MTIAMMPLTEMDHIKTWGRTIEASCTSSAAIRVVRKIPWKSVFV
jgi:hypothetical protein